MTIRAKLRMDFGPWSGPWVAHTKGSVREYPEVAVIRKDYRHGFESYGWHDLRCKIILLSGGHEDCHPEIFRFAQRLARRMAKELNSKRTK